MLVSPDTSGEKRFYEILKSHETNIDLDLQRCQKAADRIAAIIRKHPFVTVTRHAIGSNFGKRKTLNEKVMTGVDLYPFFELEYTRNHFIQNSFPGLVESIKAILSHEGFKVTDINDFAVEVCVPGNDPVVVNVYPVVDFKEAVDFQWDEVVGRCLADQSNVPFVQASAIEKLLQFLNAQEPFTKEVVKLAKIWDENNLHLPYLERRPMIIELVAIKAGQEEIDEMGVDQLLGSAMGRFFEYLKKDLRCLRILFDKKLLSKDAIQKYDERLEQTGGILIDPVNPFVNYVEDAKVKRQWKRLEEVATLSYKNWNEFQKNGDDAYVDIMLGFS